MPAIKSSSKTGTTVVLYGSETRDLNDVVKLATWLAEHHKPVESEADALARACKALLAKLS